MLRSSTRQIPRRARRITTSIAGALSLFVAVSVLMAGRAHALPIAFSVSFDGYSVSAGQTDVAPDPNTAPDCAPGAPCPGTKRTIRFAFQKSPSLGDGKKLELAVVPDVLPEAVEVVGGVRRLADTAFDAVVSGEAVVEFKELTLTVSSRIRDVADLLHLIYFDASVSDIDEVFALYEATATFASGHTPFAAALVLFDPETGEGQSVVAQFVSEPASALTFGAGLAALGVWGFAGRSRVRAARGVPADPSSDWHRSQVQCADVVPCPGEFSVSDSGASRALSRLTAG